MAAKVKNLTCDISQHVTGQVPTSQTSFSAIFVATMVTREQEMRRLNKTHQHLLTNPKQQ